MAVQELSIIAVLSTLCPLGVISPVFSFSPDDFVDGTSPI